MPEFAFTGPYASTYPEGKDAAGANLGTVQPGQIRDLDEAPDQWWREAADEDRAALQAAAGAAAQPGQEPAEAGAGEGAGSGPALSPAPVPVPVPVPAA